MAQEEEILSLEAKFAAAVKVIWSLPEEGSFQLSDDMMLMFYSYYQQATMGPCNISRPNGFWDPHGTAKWDAWNSLGNMTKEEAMRKYIEDIQQILETIPVSEDVSDLVQKLGDFYCEVEGGGEEDEKTEMDRRPFTRPFTKQAADELDRPLKNQTTQVFPGYGDLWEHIQHPHEMDSEEAAENNEDSEMERKEVRSDGNEREEEENGDGEDIIDDGDKEKVSGWSPDQRMLMAEDRMRWSDIRGSSSSSVEPSMSSLTNGTHSSLNSEMEEEELAYSIEPTVQKNLHLHFNGHLSDQNHHSAESDNEEFCDSMEHLAVEEGPHSSKVQSPGSRAVSSRQKEVLFESNTTMNGDEDHLLSGDTRLQRSTAHLNSSMSHTESQSPKNAWGPQPCTRVDGACHCVSKTTHSVSVSSRKINEQISVALLRLQNDMANVLQRLHMLEVLTVSQSRTSSPIQEESIPVARKFRRPSWWPFDHSPFTVALTTLWPLIAYWLVQLYSQRKRRNIT